jgi:hypothetical protein
MTFFWNGAARYLQSYAKNSNKDSYPVVEEDDPAEREHIVEKEGEKDVGLSVPILTGKTEIYLAIFHASFYLNLGPECAGSKCKPER